MWTDCLLVFWTRVKFAILWAKHKPVCCAQITCFNCGVSPLGGILKCLLRSLHVNADGWIIAAAARHRCIIVGESVCAGGLFHLLIFLHWKKTIKFPTDESGRRLLSASADQQLISLVVCGKWEKLLLKGIVQRLHPFQTIAHHCGLSSRVPAQNLCRHGNTTSGFQQRILPFVKATSVTGSFQFVLWVELKEHLLEAVSIVEGGQESNSEWVLVRH